MKRGETYDYGNLYKLGDKLGLRTLSPDEFIQKLMAEEKKHNYKWNPSWKTKMLIRTESIARLTDCYFYVYCYNVQTPHKFGTYNEKKIKRFAIELCS